MTWQELVNKAGTNNAWKLQEQFKEVIRMNRLLGKTEDDDLLSEMLAFNYKMLQTMEELKDECRRLGERNNTLEREANENDWGGGWK